MGIKSLFKMSLFERTHILLTSVGCRSPHMSGYDNYTIRSINRISIVAEART